MMAMCGVDGCCSPGLIILNAAFFNKSRVTLVASAGTALLSISFIYAATTQEFLESCIFLFVKHPYDVGNGADINEQQFVVDRISLLYTTFHRIEQDADYSDKLSRVPSVVHLSHISSIPNMILNNL
ncbi:uncharacterized protein TrAtP1_010126 [Trichoderma atroviride]|uniref:uncharacterized protein n=1 Tax=Hypocrea atroviridis TaxID=63577 RepID=UPI003319F9ED|nr:hypothetical protein TrAtP1_010126 [Trichoderma atroviride]